MSDLAAVISFAMQHGVLPRADDHGKTIAFTIPASREAVDLIVAQAVQFGILLDGFALDPERPVITSFSSHDEALAPLARHILTCASIHRLKRMTGLDADVASPAGIQQDAEAWGAERRPLARLVMNAFATYAQLTIEPDLREVLSMIVPVAKDLRGMSDGAIKDAWDVYEDRRTRARILRTGDGELDCLRGLVEAITGRAPR